MSNPEKKCECGHSIYLHGVMGCIEPCCMCCCDCFYFDDLRKAKYDKR